ncbi:MAG TPA: SDR family oxidoreductase [Spirochaetia bacterium]|nr:SDR family oxidoreductase [Spirochaetia bacterium]
MSGKSERERVAVVTGAGSGIGAAIAARFGARGWKVILGGRREKPLRETAAMVEARGGTAVICPADVTVPEDVRRLIDAAGERLDALVHSAGQGHCLTIDELDFHEWRRTLEVAATGAFLTAKEALPKLRTGTDGDGFVIQICSLASGGTWHLEVGYGTAKAAQLKFALHLASQFAEEKRSGGRTLHSLAVCPGTTYTPFWDRIPERPPDPNLTLTADEVAWVVDRWIDHPAATAETLEKEKPRSQIVVKRHPPFEAWDNVVAIAHESHP